MVKITNIIKRIILIKIKRIKIGHDGKGVGAGWFLDNVEIKIPSKGEIYSFVAQRWLATDEADGELEVELYPSEVKEQNASEIQIFTATLSKLNEITLKF